MKIISENKIVLILFLLLVILVLSGSAGALELKELTVEEVKEIKLFENPSTGYQWEVEVNSPEVISLINNSFEALAAKASLSGRGGIRSWSFKAEKKGLALVNFKLLAPEEDKVVSQIKYIFAVDLPAKEITVDEILKINLSENPSTGYRWQFDLSENKNIQLLREEYIPLAQNSEIDDNNKSQSKKEETQMIVGQGGIKSWTFRGIKAGYQLLTFKLARSGGEAIKTVDYLVLVD